MPYACISSGNMKLGSVHSISLPPIKTCAKRLPCHKMCYARQSYKQYPGVRRAYDRNLARWKSDPDRYFGSIAWQIVDKGLLFFRWHVSGDIPAKSYIQGMIDVANKVPGCRFLAFTKRYDWVSGIRFPRNLTVVLSAWPGVKLPKTTRPIAFMQDGCESRSRAKTALHCPGGCQNCGRCWILPQLKRDVVFPLHSGPIASAKARRLRKTG